MTSEQFRTNPMFLRNQFKGDGVFEIPKIEKEEIPLENIKLIGYDKISEKSNQKQLYVMVNRLKKCKVMLLLSTTSKPTT